MVKRQLLVLLFVLLAPISAYAVTEVSASIDKNPVMEGEYVTLTITANDDVQAAALNTEALNKDFYLGQTSVGRSTQIINFDTSKETRWQVLISPKHLGKITIPSFSIDGISSKPIELTVVSAANQSQQATQAKNIFIKTSLSTNEAYVGQLIIYKVKLYLAADLQRGVLNAPVVEGADIKQIGADKDTTDIVNGKRYRVIERTYGITADVPGKLMIGGVNFVGDVIVNSPSNMGFGSGFIGFNESRPVQARSVGHTVLIDALPANVSSDAFVADFVSLKDNIDKQQSFEVGVPISRTVTLFAANMEDNALPSFSIPVPDGFKVYPEKPKRETVVRDGQLVAKLTQTVAIVPSKPGQFTLPAIDIPWWNPHTKKAQTAKLAAVTIKVKPAAMQIETPVVTGQGATATDVTPSIANNSVWLWLTAFFAILWLITLLLWRRSFAHNQGRRTKEVSVKGGNHSRDIADIKTACKQQDAGLTLMAIQQHFSQLYGQPITLDKIASMSVELNMLIKDLQKVRYSQNQFEMDFSQIEKRLQQSKVSLSKTDVTDLSPLNPH